MTGAYLAAVIALLVGIGVCALLAYVRATMAALVALELAGVLTTMSLVCLSVGFQNSTYTNVAVICALLTWIGGLVFVRFLDRT